MTIIHYQSSNTYDMSKIIKTMRRKLQLDDKIMHKQRYNKQSETDPERRKSDPDRNRPDDR